MNSPPFASRLRWRASWAPPTCGSVMNKPAVNILAPAPCPGACRILRLGQQGARVSQEPETRLPEEEAALVPPSLRGDRRGKSNSSLVRPQSSEASCHGMPHAWRGPHGPGREPAREDRTGGRGPVAPSRDLAGMCPRASSRQAGDGHPPRVPCGGGGRRGGPQGVPTGPPVLP